MRRFNALISFIALFSIYTGALPPVFAQKRIAMPRRVPANQNNMNQQTPEGLKFRLSEGAEGAETRQTTPPTAGETLSASDAENVLKRLPPVKAEKDDQQDFAKRAGTLPAPKTGEKIPQKFPAGEQAPAPNQNSANALEVVRYSPEGEVDLAPDLSVTFSQPMVAVTSQEQAAQNVPVQLTPQPEGRWRWLGTKTLIFDAAKRLPMATRFTARIPAGTKSATGQTLAKDVTWTFATPPPKVETMIPADETTRRDALMFVSFDQEINAEAVLKTISVTSAGKKLLTRLAAPEEIDTDASVSYYAKQAPPKRWLAFRAVNGDGTTENALPAGSQINVAVEKGTASAEGPLTTLAPQTSRFRTFGALKFVKGVCGYEGGKTCSPFDNWSMQFSNPIDAAVFTKETVTIEPKIEGVNIYPSGNYIYIQGAKKGRTSYKVTVNGNLKDTFGQTLGALATATFNVGTAPASLYSQGGNFVTLDPTAKPVYSIYSTNHTSVKLKIYAVAPENWEAFRGFIKYLNYDEQKRPPMPGKLVVDKILPI